MFHRIFPMLIGIIFSVNSTALAISNSSKIASTFTKNINTHVSSIPVLANADITIVESTITGCFLATELSNKGLKVILCASGSSLPKEIAVDMRSWITEKELAAMPDELKKLFLKNIKYGTGNGEYIVHTGKITETIEDMLLDAGVTIYYDMQPCRVSLNLNKEISHIFFGGKFGVQAIRTNAIIDCTPQSIISHLSNAPIQNRYPLDSSIDVSQNFLLSWEKTVVDSLNIESEKYFTGERQTIPKINSQQNIPLDVRFPDNQQIVLHGQNAEFTVPLIVDVASSQYYSDIILQTNNLIYEASTLLAKQEQTDHFFYRPADDVTVPSLFRIKSDAENHGWNHPDLNKRVELCNPSNASNLWLCNACIDVENKISNDMNNPYHRFEIANALLASLPEKMPVVEFFADTKVSRLNQNKYHVKFTDVLPLYSTGESVEIANIDIPVMNDMDILIVGGGTSGLPAALTASEQNLSVMLIEKHAQPGGTRTIGGVTEFWFGHKSGFFEELNNMEQMKIQESNLHKSAGMLQLLNEKKVQILLKTAAVGTIVSDNGLDVKGVVVVTPHGLRAIMATCIIDATGDGDIAAWGGADYYYGNGRDALTMWCSFGKYNVPYGAVSRKYNSVVEMRDVTDLTRAKITARRRIGLFGMGEYPQHYFTVRESRHISGRDTVTYGKILSGKNYSDLMMLCKSNFDIKGIASSDLARCGFVSWDYNQNFVCGVPYSAIIPAKLNNILVIGKAYSASHDALSLARMQLDMIAMGGAAGIAASMAVKTQSPLAEINISDFQQKLLDYGILTNDDIQTFGEPGNTPQAAILTKIEANLQKQEFVPVELVDILMQGQKAIPFLKQAFKLEKIIDKKVHLARGLCYLQDTTGVRFLLQNIRTSTHDSLPFARKESTWIRRNQPPDHGWAPDPAYSIYAIGLTKSACQLSTVLPDIIEKIESIHDFEYILSICQAAERSGSKMFIPLLEKLIVKPFLSDLTIPTSKDQRITIDLKSERLAYLEFSIARALARCGSQRGYEILIDYLQDMRGFIARSALEELSDLTGAKHEMNWHKWNKWLLNNQQNLSPRPFYGRIE